MARNLGKFTFEEMKKLVDDFKQEEYEVAR
jgi:hypothetical protein